MSVSEALLQQFQEITMQSRRTAYYFIDMFGRGNLNDAIMSFFDLGIDYIPDSYVEPEPPSRTPQRQVEPSPSSSTSTTTSLPPTPAPPPPPPITRPIVPMPGDSPPPPLPDPTPQVAPTTPINLTNNTNVDMSRREDEEFIENDELIKHLLGNISDRDSLKFNRVRDSLHKFFSYTEPPPRLSVMRKQKLGNAPSTEKCSKVLEFHKENKKTRDDMDQEDIIVETQPNLNINTSQVIVWRDGLTIDGKFVKHEKEEMKTIIADIKRGKTPNCSSVDVQLIDMRNHKYNPNKDTIELLENF